jgi:hypothetical protein
VYTEQQFVERFRPVPPVLNAGDLLRPRTPMQCLTP